MRLTLLSDYSLRLLMHVAIQPNQLVTIGETAAVYGISKNHLMKVANMLSRDGFLETVRGRSGGLRIRTSPSLITLGAVVRRMESGAALVECFPEGKGGCKISPACRLKSILQTAEEAFYQVLDNFTLEDLIRNNEQLKDLLEPASI